MTAEVEQTLRGRILVVDDEKNIAKTFKFCLEDEGYRVSVATNDREALLLVQQDVFDLCFLDLRLGDVSGLDLIPDLTSTAPWMKIVMITAYSSIESAIEAVRRGAADYLAKPCSPEQLRIAAQQQLERSRIENRLARLESQLRQSGSTETVMSESPTMMQVLDMARSVADTDATVLIRGESGTGKNVIARTIGILWLLVDCTVSVLRS